jgi:hypothetical protein
MGLGKDLDYWHLDLGSKFGLLSGDGVWRLDMGVVVREMCIQMIM